MASNGAEDVKRASPSAGTVKAGPAGVRLPTHSTSHPLERRLHKSSQPRPHLPFYPGTPSNVRVLQDRLYFISGIAPHRAYLAVPTVGTAGAGGAVVTRIPTRSGVPLLPFNSPCRFEQTIQSYRPYWRLESLKFKSGILGKRAFSSHQTTLYPTCPSPQKAPSDKLLTTVESAMPTNQPSAWTSQPRINNNAFMKPTSAKVPSYPRRESSNKGMPSATYTLSASYYYGEQGDCNLETTSAKGTNSVPSLSCSMPFPEESLGDNPEKSLNVILEEVWRVPHSQSLAPGVCSERTTTEWGKARNGHTHVRLTEAVRKLTGNACQLKNGVVNGVVRQPVSNGGPLASQCLQNGSGDAKMQQAAKPSRPSLQGDPGVELPAKASKFCLMKGDMDCSWAPMTVLDSLTKRESPMACCSPSCIEATQGLDSAMSPQGESAETSSSQVASVYSVTSRISAIHLSKEARPLAKQDDACAIEMKDLDPEDEAMQQGVDEEEEEEEELTEDLDNECSVDEDDDDERSDCSSMNDTSSTASMVLISRSCTEESVMTLSDNKVLKPALVPSLFPNVPPTLYFSTPDETVQPLPAEQRKLLKWKMSTVTPNVVKHTIARSHFKVTKKNHDWLGCWGHHMKSPGFKAIREYQKLNHFPGSFQIGRKDRLWRNLSKMQARFGKREFNFFPQSFVLPQDIKLLKKAWEECGSKQKWIIKPPASARGIGIQVIHKWSQLPRRRPLLVQKYLHKPYLISGSKFDLRIYVYVTSYDPLRVYMFTDGLVRFASCKYSSSMKSLSNKFMHITNYSVNKNNSAYQPNSDDKACQGHKWALKALWQYLNAKGVDTTLIWEKIKDIVIKTIIASDPYVNSLVKMHVRCPYSCHELFGFDIMLDENLKPWVLEVNISPSLHSNSPLDVNVKGQMIRDLFNLAGFVLPQKDDVTPAGSASGSTSSLSAFVKAKSKLATELSSDEKVKRAYFLSQRFADQEFFSSVLDLLTPDDVRVLVEMEDEFCRKGEFERVFPSPSSSRYLRFFEQPRYLNLLLNQWEQKYYLNRQKGVNLLKSLCQKGVHMGNNLDPAHMWSSKSSAVQKLEPHSILTPTQEHLRAGTAVSDRKKAPNPDETTDIKLMPCSRSLPLLASLGTADSQTSQSLHNGDLV